MFYDIPKDLIMPFPNIKYLKNVVLNGKDCGYAYYRPGLREKFQTNPLNSLMSYFSNFL